MAQRIRRLPTEQEIPGSSPGKGFLFFISFDQINSQIGIFCLYHVYIK